MTDGPNANYNAELECVAQLASAAASAAVAPGRRLYGDHLGRLTNAYLLYRYLVERGDINAASKAIQILYSKMANCLGGILHLLENGYAGPAAMVLRGLVETAVHLQVILKEDTPARCQLFEDFLFIERNTYADAATVTAEQRARNDADYARVRANYHPKHPYSWCWKAVPSRRSSGRGGPDNPNFKELCEHIGHPEYHDQLYGPLSSAIHPVPSYEIWLRRQDGLMELGPIFRDHIRRVAELAITLALDSFARLVEALQVPDSLSLSAFALNLLPPHILERTTA